MCLARVCAWRASHAASMCVGCGPWLPGAERCGTWRCGVALCVRVRLRRVRMCARIAFTRATQAPCGVKRRLVEKGKLEILYLGVLLALYSHSFGTISVYQSCSSCFGLVSALRLAVLLEWLCLLCCLGLLCFLQGSSSSSCLGLQVSGTLRTRRVQQARAGWPSAWLQRPCQESRCFCRPRLGAAEPSVRTRVDGRKKVFETVWAAGYARRVGIYRCGPKRDF